MAAHRGLKEAIDGDPLNSGEAATRQDRTEHYLPVERISASYHPYIWRFQSRHRNIGLSSP